MSKYKTKKTIALDFDGVIHKYSKGYLDGSIYDEPIEGAFEAIREMMDNGFAVYIHSTRPPWKIKQWMIENTFATEYETEGMGGDPTNYKYPKYGFTLKVIPFWKKFWNEENVVGISRRKIPALVYVDDRAMKFDGDWEKSKKEILSL